MAIRIGNVVMNCADLKLMVEFWSTALRLPLDEPVVPEDTWWVLRTGRIDLAFQPVQTPISGRDQMHLDLHTDDQPGEVARLVALGATHLRDHHDPQDDYVVLADPEGNPFCVVATATEHTG